MIRVTAVTRPDANLIRMNRQCNCNVLPGETSWVGTADDPRPAFLLALVNDGDTVSAERTVGSLQQGDRVWGKLRDKEVQHFSVTGELTLAPGSAPSGSDDMPVVLWGQSTLWNAHERPSYRYWHAPRSTYYTCLGRIETHQVVFDNDDHAIVISTAEQDRTVLDNGTEVWGPGVLCQWQRFRRSGDDLYALDGSNQYTPLSGPQIASLLENCANTGGTKRPVHSILQGQSASSDFLTSVLDRIEDRMPTYHVVVTDHRYVLGELALECAKQLDFVQTNVLFLLYDVADWKSFHGMWKYVTHQTTWLQAIEASKQFVRGNMTRREFHDLFDPASSTYLFAKYVVLPDVSDVKRLAQGIGRSALFLDDQRLHSRKVDQIDIPGTLTSTLTTVMTVETKKYPSNVVGKVQELIALAKRFGMYPEMVNLWDAVRYSFVVDWFVQFGDLFRDVDDAMDVENYFPVHHVIMSEKWEQTMAGAVVLGEDYDRFAIDGVLAYKLYTRWITEEIPLPPVSLSWESALGNHLVESGALILQRIR